MDTGGLALGLIASIVLGTAFGGWVGLISGGVAFAWYYANARRST